MDCKYVRQSSCLCFTFHPLASSLFYLTNTKNRLRIIEQNLYTGLVKNEFSVPLRQQSLNVDNYLLSYNARSREVILTLSNQILVYSLQLKTLIFVGEAYQNKSPCFIEKAVFSNGYLYFSATDQFMVFSVKLSDCINAGTINQYTKFKIPEVRVLALAVGNKKLVALCSDCNLRVWDSQSAAILKGIAIERVGEPVCLSFSKQYEHLLVGTASGVVLGYDAHSLGEKNTNILNKQIGKERIQSICWFHYSGEAQSRRFLALTKDGNVKLFSFYFEKVRESRQARQRYMGRANELSLLYINKCQMTEYYEIRSHEFSNFIYFHPGVLLYMVDFYPRIYYPAITPQYVHSFQSLVPNTRKEIYFQGNFLYIDGLLLKRLRKEPQTKLSLDSVLQYKGLKILKMDFRPKFTSLEELPLNIVKGVPAQKLRYKILIGYYLDNMIRCLALSNICLSGTNDTIDNLKQYSGQAFHFLGPQNNLNPLLMILQQDRQTITVLNESSVDDTSYYLEQQRPYLKMTGELYSKQLKIKIQKIFQTPFRNNYVVLYLSENLIRFSNNIHVHSELLDYEVYLNLSLRLDYSDIIIDIVWTSRGQIGCVVCLEKVVLINDELKIIKSVPIQGYVIQGQFVGYTLVVTTKVDVQYVDVAGHPLQLFCIENYESKYLILGILADRILGIQKFQGTTNCKMRYLNLMQPLISGYLNYYSMVQAPINPQVIKAVIEGFAPYHIVSQEFLALLNKSSLSNFSRYFIESNIKLYSRPIRAATFNSEVRIQRFIANKVWLQHKNKILDYVLYYEELKDSSDNYELQKAKEYERLLIKMIGNEALNTIQQVVKEEQSKALERPSIVNSFGEQSLFSVFYEFSEKQNIFVKMELIPFKANDDREWMGITGLYLESKIGENNEEVDVNAVQEQQAQNQHEGAQEQNAEDEENQYAALIVYYRFDDGKGDLVDDLSDYHNEAYVQGEPWRLLQENDPLELQDKWGKKCPPQYSIYSGIVKRDKKIGSKGGRAFTFQIWIKTQQASFCLLKLGQHFQFGMQNGIFCYKTNEIHLLKGSSEDFEYVPGNWTNITFAYNHKQHKIVVYLNSFVWYQGKDEINFNRNGLQIGTSDFNGEFTEFRLWRKQLPIQMIKQYLRSPLELVAEKRKKMRMKIKQRKKKRQKMQGQGQFFPTIEL